LGLLVDQHGVLDGEHLTLEHFFDGGGLFECAADELVLLLVADFSRVLGVLDEVVGEFFLLADGFFDGAKALADLHLAFDSSFVFGFEKAHEFLERFLTTKGTKSTKKSCGPRDWV
jgi:hypothetical protein